jgi:hypothetical protein
MYGTNNDLQKQLGKATVITNFHMPVKNKSKLIIIIMEIMRELHLFVIAL